MKQFILALGLILTASTQVFANDEHQGHARPDAHLAWTRDNIHARIYWEVKPTIGGDATLRLEVMDGNIHQPTKIDATVTAELWMPLHNHGSSPVTIEKIAAQDGTFDVDVYRFSKLFFMMQGDWEVRVTLTYPDGFSEMQSFVVTLP